MRSFRQILHTSFSEIVLESPSSNGRLSATDVTYCWNVDCAYCVPVNVILPIDVISSTSSVWQISSKGIFVDTWDTPFASNTRTTFTTMG